MSKRADQSRESKFGRFELLPVIWKLKTTHPKKSLLNHGHSCKIICLRDKSFDSVISTVTQSITTSLPFFISTTPISPSIDLLLFSCSLGIDPRWISFLGFCINFAITPPRSSTLQKTALNAKATSEVVLNALLHMCISASGTFQKVALSSITSSPSP